jgi:pentafunctional AROM polypeptide
VSALSASEGVRREVARFFGQITGTKPNLVDLASGKRSYFLSLTFPEVAPALAHLDTLAAGADALELRVDLLRAPADADVTGAYVPPLSYVADQVAALRRASDLPIVYTVRTATQGGAFPDGAADAAFALFELGLRLGVEYVDVETTWPEDRVKKLVAAKGVSQIIASWHDWTGAFNWADAQEKYDRAATFGDIVKIVGKANSLADNFTLRTFVEKVAAAPGAKPLIAINMGVHGQLSRVLNETLSPVTHPLLPTAAAPGQMSVAEVHAALHLLGALPAREFALLGSPIAHSPSPALHNTAFGALGLPHKYGLLETAEAEDARVHELLHSPTFGGASVTIPLKETVVPLMDELSADARAIGAVNTIIVDDKRRLIGDNTDWTGIVECVRAQWPLGAPLEAGLVLGAGGTARAAVHALRALGAGRVYLYNRTRARAEAVRAAFPDADITVLDTLGTWPGAAPRVVVGTVPADAQEALVGGVSALLGAPAGVLVDMAYKPARTPLLALAETAGWTTVRGVDVLLAQGLAQLRLWTGRRAPREHVRTAVMGKYEEA